MRTRSIRILALLGAAAAASGCRGKSLDVEKPTPVVTVTVDGDPAAGAGVDGLLDEPMSTAFQAAAWQKAFFYLHPEERDPSTSSLPALNPHHVLVQVFDPTQVADATGTHWDFRELDAVVQPLLALGETPLIQIESAPDTTSPNDPAGFAAYCAGLVSYYNGAGVSPGPDGGTIRSPGPPITWWAIWSDPNTNDFIHVNDFGMGGMQYAATYTAAVAQMQAASPTPLKFVGPEANDCIDQPGGGRSGTCNPVSFIVGFLQGINAPSADGGVTPLDALSLHMFSTDLAVTPGASPDASVQDIPDRTVFRSLGQFASDIQNIRFGLVDAGRPNTPIWVTESQVNSDTPTLDGSSGHAITTCSGCSVPFQADVRGTDAFFAAWRPALFAALGQAGNQELFQWQHTAGRCPDTDAGCSTLLSSDTDLQNSEIDYTSGQKYLSYWVNHALSHLFQAGDAILTADVSDPFDDPPSVTALATRRGGNGAAGEETVVVMVSNASTQDPTDVDGTGAHRTVVVSLQGLLNANGRSAADWSATMFMLDAKTDLDAGPTPTPVSLSNDWVPISFSNGYGTAFLQLTLTR